MANTLVISIAMSNTTLALFRAWAGASTYAAGLPTAGGISYAHKTLGWTQTNDTGQVVWVATVLTLTQVAVGATAVYSYSSFTGPAPRVGMSITVSGFVTGGNNVSNAIITAVSGGSSGTVTVALSTQVNETHAGSATTTALAATPASGTTVYEVWQMNDGLAGSFPCIVKWEYGSGATNADPNLFVTIGLASDGAGNITGTMATARTAILSSTIADDNTLRNCFFCGTSARMGICMAETVSATNSPAFVFNVERSHDSSGNDTSAYLSINIQGAAGGGRNASPQQALLYGIAGIPPTVETRWVSAFPVAGTTWTFNSTTAIAVVNPVLGVIGNPVLGVVLGKGSDWLDQSTFQITLYGSSHTYLVLLGTNIWSGAGIVTYQATVNLMIGMRWE